eukprot:TRINITY_DN451_c2_g1_i1.p1 TRINITY_DN451_c2_g1~~TRINITY_DN451_c2_g1_i1.p1  ORF type:complete len:757 (+),score=138.64 TRINITY_DN451_c2_g1_i1:67-2337(+)
MGERVDLTTDAILNPITNPPKSELRMNGLYAMWQGKKIHAKGDGEKGIMCWVVVTGVFIALCKDNSKADLIRIARVADIQKIWLHDPKNGATQSVTIAIQMLPQACEPTMVLRLGMHNDNRVFNRPPTSYIELLQVINKVFFTYKGTNVPCERVTAPLYGYSQAGPFNKPSGYKIPKKKKKKWNLEGGQRKIAPLNPQQQPPPQGQGTAQQDANKNKEELPKASAPEQNDIVGEKQPPHKELPGGEETGRILTDMHLGADSSNEDSSSSETTSQDSDEIENHFAASANTSPAYNYSSPSNFQPQAAHPPEAPAYPSAYERETLYPEQPPATRPVFSGDPPSVHLHLVMDSDIPDGQLAIDDNLPPVSPVGRGANDIGFTNHAPQPPSISQPAPHTQPHFQQQPQQSFPAAEEPAYVPDTVSVTPPHPSKFASRRGIGPGGPGGGGTPYGGNSNSGPGMFSHGDQAIVGSDIAHRLSEPSPRGMSRSDTMDRTHTTIRTVTGIEPSVPTPQSGIQREPVEVVEYSNGQVVTVSRNTSRRTDGFEKFSPSSSPPPTPGIVTNPNIEDRSQSGTAASGSPTSYEDGFARGFAVAMTSLKNDQPPPTQSLAVDRASSPMALTHREWAQDRAISAKLQLLKESFNEPHQKEPTRGNHHREVSRHRGSKHKHHHRSNRHNEEDQDRLFFESISRGSEADALQNSVFGSSAHSSVPRYLPVERQASVRSPRRKKSEPWPPKQPKTMHWKSFVDEWDDRGRFNI